MNNICDMMEALRPFFGGSLSAFYLYGSAAMDDLRPGWSDIDVLVLLDRPPAEEWVGLCPVEEDLRRALDVRRELMKYRDDPDTLAWLGSLAPAVMRYADTLEKEWMKT